MLESDPSIRIMQGDCRKLLQAIPDHAVDLIFTSPPYADSRRKTYGGIPPDEYVTWFLPVASELYRVLKPSGTFILNIKEKTTGGERSTYVLELILALRKSGWLWTEELVWHKKNSFPGKWPNRFRDAWERLLQFNKSRRFSMYQDAVKIPMGDWAETRLQNLSEHEKQRQTNKTQSGFGRNFQNWIGKETVYPTNVLHLATECGNKNHSAAFPEPLAEWFVKLFTVQNDTVLDPFLGSGTTGVVCHRLNRRFIGIELVPEYVDRAKQRIFSTNIQERKLFE